MWRMWGRQSQSPRAEWHAVNDSICSWWHHWRLTCSSKARWINRFLWVGKGNSQDRAGCCLQVSKPSTRSLGADTRIFYNIYIYMYIYMYIYVYIYIYIYIYIDITRLSLFAELWLWQKSYLKLTSTNVPGPIHHHLWAPDPDSVGSVSHTDFVASKDTGRMEQTFQGTFQRGSGSKSFLLPSFRNDQPRILTAYGWNRKPDVRVSLSLSLRTRNVSNFKYVHMLLKIVQHLMEPLVVGHLSSHVVTLSCHHVQDPKQVGDVRLVTGFFPETRIAPAQVDKFRRFKTLAVHKLQCVSWSEQVMRVELVQSLEGQWLLLTIARKTLNWVIRHAEPHVGHRSSGQRVEDYITICPSCLTLGLRLRNFMLVGVWWWSTKLCRVSIWLPRRCQKQA